MCKKEEEIAVLKFFKKIDFPGISLGENCKTTCGYLKSQNYSKTPDLVAGPKNLEDAPVEGLFFIDVNQPTGDMLFKSLASKNLNIDIAKIVKEKFQRDNSEGKDTFIDSLPNEHHQYYLNVINDKLDKYAHERKFIQNGKLTVTANFGIVHHFNLGELNGNNISNSKKLLTLIDYIRFYKSLAPSDNVDLRNAESLLFEETINLKQKAPYLLAIGRNWHDVPHLFLMLHIVIKKENEIQDLALLAVNTFLLDNSDMTHPVHKWFAGRILHPLSKQYMNNKFTPKHTVFKVKNGFNLFT